jgi:hypothetical protein
MRADEMSKYQQDRIENEANTDKRHPHITNTKT